MSNEIKPLVFISHKHSDAAIAHAIGSFFDLNSNNKLDVFLSSAVEYAQDLRIGHGLTTEIANAAARAMLMILIYTGDDKDWSWCMFEAGIALDPRTPPPANLVVIHFGHEPARMFSGRVTVNATKQVEITKFVNQLLCTPELVHDGGKKISPFDANSNQIEKLSEALYKDIIEKIPEDLTMVTNYLWPAIKIRLDLQFEKQVRQLGIAKLSEHLIIDEEHNGAMRVFGASATPSKGQSLAWLFGILKQKLGASRDAGAQQQESSDVDAALQACVKSVMDAMGGQVGSEIGSGIPDFDARTNYLILLHKAYRKVFERYWEFEFLLLPRHFSERATVSQA